MTDSAFSSICSKVESVFPLSQWRNLDVLVAVSGGADSIALLRALVRIKNKTAEVGTGRIVVAHCNHQTRETCAGEAKFVNALCVTLDVECVTLDFSQHPNTEESADHSEESLRDWRYQQLLALAKRLGIRYLLTGHHRDDQIETVLFRLIRGTGLSGLGGIPTIRVDESVTIVRPLLNVGRAEIESGLADLQQEFCQDASNQDSSYSRNFIRNELLPTVHQRFGKTIDNSIVRLSQQASELDDFLNAEVSNVYQRAILKCCEIEISIDIQTCAELPAIVVRHLLKTAWRDANWPEQSMTYHWWQTLCDLAQGRSNEVHNVPGNVITECENQTLILRRS